MNAGLFRPLRWFDGLRGRIAAALLIALAVQFIGSDIIFERIETDRMERGRAQRLADWLSFADEFAGTHPDAVERMTALWQPDLVVSRSAATPPGREPQSDAGIARTEILVRAARRQMDSLGFRATREGRDLVGSMRLSSGGWLVFRARDYFTERSQLYHYIASALLLLLCVVLVVLLFGRMIAQPLKRIAEAAERVGREEDIPVVVEGPREVRQVAAAFGRMQARLFAQFRDRVQSMAAMSHDLRTPLARMRLNAASVEDADTRAALEQDVDEMEGSCQSNANRSPLGGGRPTTAILQAMRDCHSAQATERRSLKVFLSTRWRSWLK
ncbi:MAG: HAMP domain-containing protein [Novosphingobium sp.]|nr:HAMP domain-containing protein [Novosphingobium sp.]